MSTGTIILAIVFLIVMLTILAKIQSLRSAKRRHEMLMTAKYCTYCGCPMEDREIKMGATVWDPTTGEGRAPRRKARVCQKHRQNYAYWMDHEGHDWVYVGDEYVEVTPAIECADQQAPKMIPSPNRPDPGRVSS